MTTFHVNPVSDERIIIGKIDAQFDVRNDMAGFADAMISAFDSAAVPVYFVLDMTDLNMTFPDMVTTMADLTKGELAAWRHANLKELVIVSEQTVVKIGAEALAQTQYGKVRTMYFTNPQEALDYVRLMQSLHGNR